MKVVDVVNVVENADNSEPSHEAVKGEVVESVPEVTGVSGDVPNDAPTVEPSTDEGFKTVKPKKSAEIVTCPYCNKSMTQKSFKKYCRYKSCFIVSLEAHLNLNV